MQFFKQEHVIRKLKEDAEKLVLTMDYIDERLADPCEIYSIEKSWPAEKLLRKDIADIIEKRMEIEEFTMHNQQNAAKNKVFRKCTIHFINTIDAHVSDIHNQLTKYGMKPMFRAPIRDRHEDLMKSLESELEVCSLTK